jgi:hypothetical protein
MNKRVLAGIAAGLLTAAVLATVAIGAYQAGQRNDRTITVVGQTTSAGQTIVVPADSVRDGWGGPPFGLILFPLLVVGVILLVTSRRRHYGGYRRGWGGPAWVYDCDTDPREWHRGRYAGDAACRLRDEPPAAAEPPPTPADSTD